MAFIDITGQRFGRLVAIEAVNSDREARPKRRWKCRCDCGQELLADGARLRDGHTKSCGCKRKDDLSARRTTHGAARKGRKARLYNIWQGMKRRCNKEYEPCYSRYGGRGIRVCAEWNDSYETFQGWALANGYSDGLSIDRIDNDGNYEPANCRWASTAQQARNKRNTKHYEVNGRVGCVTDHAEWAGIAANTLQHRVNHGIPLADAIIDIKRRADAKLSRAS